MRFVLDTNQAGRFLSQKRLSSDQRKATVIVIAPLVWAEIVVGHRQRESRVRAIAEYDLEFGNDVREVYRVIASMDEDAIRDFRPFVPRNSAVHQQLLQSFEQPSQQMIQYAQEIRSDASADAMNLARALHGYRKEFRDRRSRGENLDAVEPYNSINEVVAQHLHSRSRMMQQFVGESLRGEFTSSGGLSIDERAEVILRNPYMQRFLRSVLCFHIGYANCWMNSELNRIDPSSNRNDYTDMTLPLYAEDGDIMVTNDRYLRATVGAIDPEQRITVKTWDECVELLAAFPT